MSKSRLHTRTIAQVLRHIGRSHRTRRKCTASRHVCRVSTLHSVSKPLRFVITPIECFRRRIIWIKVGLDFSQSGAPSQMGQRVGNTGSLALVPPSAAMEAQTATKQSSKRGRKSQTSRRKAAQYDQSQSQHDASTVPTSPTPPDDSPTSTTGTKIKWTASEFWQLTNAVHDLGPYTAKHNEKGAQWEKVRNAVNGGMDHVRTSKSYQLQMKRLLSWQQGSKVWRFLY